jgi:hypothetical protein
VELEAAGLDDGAEGGVEEGEVGALEGEADAPALARGELDLGPAGELFGRVGTPVGSVPA